MCDLENYDFPKVNDAAAAPQESTKTINDKDVKQKMTSSLNDDADSPTQDSGVQLLDSETDLNDSMISSAVLDFESANDGVKGGSNDIVPLASESASALPDLLAFATKNTLSKSDIENNNEDNETIVDVACAAQHPDITSSICNADMMSSIHSTFDTENTEIVYRRKIKKQSKSAPKKRVSFHEDILNSTRTDNIHIEHGFITYKGRNAKTTRYSWCSEYNNEELDTYDDRKNQSGTHVYRNACSEVLDYGKTDVQDDDDMETVKYDQSGIFEYPPLNAKRFYRCTCSSSSSIESGSSSENNSNNSSSSCSNDTKSDEKCNYKQSKSSSCDCIESSQNGIEIGKGTCYFSEPNIQQRSVWNKEKKPKTSCLKKSKRTEIIQENSFESNVKKFNIHQLSSSVIKDNGKMIIGSLKDFLGISYPERGVPEGSEEAPEAQEQQSPKKDFSFLHKVGIFKPNPEKVQSLSKSLDGGFGKQNKNFVHNVDEQLRRANEDDLFAPSNSNSRKNSLKTDSSIEEKEADEDLTSSCGNNPQRNKYIINCESTVFEHTGTVEIPHVRKSSQDSSSTILSSSPLNYNPFKAKISNILNSIAGNAPNKLDNDRGIIDVEKEAYHEQDIIDNVDEIDEDENKKSKNLMESSVTSISSDKNSSIISDISSNTSASLPQNYDIKMTSKKSSRHISSPLRKVDTSRERINQARMSPDLFNRDFFGSNLQSVKNSNNILSDEFDDILTITTENTDKTLDCGNDIVIVDYSDVKNDIENNPNTSNYYLKLPSIMTSSTTSTSSKTSLINRFLRNVTQKKILEASIKRNSFFQAKLKNETKLFGGNLYVKGVKPRNESVIKDLNAEIDMEVEMGCNSLEYEEEQQSCSGSKSNRSSVCSNNEDLSYESGIGEIRIELFNKKNLKIFRDRSEVLMKAFKLYTGYSNEGYMCAVVVFLTDKTIYVVELIRNELCNKFVLPYAELDVILMGPMGNTVLLSNTARDMQQVLLTCGPYPAEKLISSLEMCARRGGFYLPAVGQLTLDHFAPLQSFVCNNSSVSKSDIWKYYSIVNIPASFLGVEDEPLGPSLQGFFMHRNLSHAGVVQKWSAGYFMLKASVLYLFNDPTQRIPNWAVSLPNECQGARRCLSSNRPHCFEILLRTGSLQLAAPDEYVCSDWLQSVVHAASRFFDINEKPKILGCTLIMTENHLITLREDFSSPLRRVTLQQPVILSPHRTFFTKENSAPNLTRKLSSSTILDTSSEVSSIHSSSASTPSRSCRSNSTMCSTPTKLSKKTNYDESQSHTNMTSFYGKNSGIEVLTCASIEELISIKISQDEESWWCILEFLCQEVRENFDDLVLFFSTSSEMQRFLSALESLWHTKMDEVFPISIATENDCPQQKHCEKLFVELNHSWDPLLSAVLNISK
ncbi:dentin sialophosphoprotein [Chironomus tepperi]|uniref:dentin sialophosphoprotein n=1 Tax=Chironomus tepperi TaxID=113505 RepID=UPI00391F3109